MLQIMKHLLLQSRGGDGVTMTLSSESPEALLGYGGVSEFFGGSNISSNSWDAPRSTHMGLP